MTDHIVPFYSQSWDLDQWRSMGFESFEDARYWKESSCGVLCLKMTIDALRHSAGKSDSPQLIQYIHGGQALEAYTHLHGWSHDGLVELAKKLGTDAERHVRTTEAQLKKWLQQGLLPIVSI